ncbi:hypothetical protein HNR06_003016 [Nocardiopsis arvandica]|uniref:Polysaccharide pyruvyl transferase domain-containing protein n=1 Tax=Nocardiopsis sinuspersici TaxID=501010 RepID=A0A7Y9XEN9_9ACTN|nr:polysaccharide pyruvyl transferase family protein [Nocardiopsis sinuspersici]NYH53427.1 hypothetical protein [Nocardiopsis sinuspersici]
MKRVLLRSKKNPLEIVGPGEGIERNIFGDNAGNLVFSHASHKTLQTSGTEVVANGFRADPADAGRINEEYDAFVIPLANAFRRTYQKQLRRLTSLVEKLRIPVIVLGVGAQSDLDYDLDWLTPINDDVKRFVSAVLDRSATIGVRGDFTEKYLNSLGFKDVEVIGCPSMFMYGDRLPQTRRTPLTAESAVAINASRSALKTGDVGSIVMANVERYPNLRYYAQETKDLALLYWGDGSGVDGVDDAMPVHRSHPLFQEDRVRVCLDPQTWIDELGTYDFSFGTRIHGNIVALLAGTPATVLCHDSRTLELCRYFDIPHRLLRDLPTNVDAVDLWEETDYTAMHSGHMERFTRYTGFLEKNGLDHVFTPGEDEGEAFEQRVRETAYPPVVHAWTGAENGVADRVGWLRENHMRTRDQVTALTKRTAELEKSVNALRKQAEKAGNAQKRPLYQATRRLGGKALRRAGLRH